MGWSWAGASEWLSEKKLEERERQKWEEARKDKMISFILPELIKRDEKRKAIAEAAKAEMSTAVRKFGMDQATAAVLYSTGELGDILPILEENYKKGSVNTAAINNLTARVREDVPPEKIAAALKYASKIGFLEQPSVEKYVETLYGVETADEVLDTAARLSAQGVQQAGPDIQAFGLNPSGMSVVDEKRRKSIQDTITATLGTQLGLTAVTDSSGVKSYQFEDPAAAGRIINNATEYYVAELQNSVFSSKSPEEIQTEIYAQLQAAQQGGLNLDAIGQLDFGPNFTNSIQEVIINAEGNPSVTMNTKAGTGEPAVDLQAIQADPNAGEESDEAIMENYNQSVGGKT